MINIVDCLRHVLRLMLGLCIVHSTAAAVFAEDYQSELQQALALGELTEPPVVHDAEGFEVVDGVRPIFFEGLPWKGRPTRVFAWLGMPQQTAGKVPGVVLVHGGGGTAYREWVQKWNEHGFAAISIAVEGQTDQPAEPGKPEERWRRHESSGPGRDGIYNDSHEPLADQWMYHAVADTVLANSLLRSLPGVDADRVGVAGISWGGVITSTVMGIDNRFAFAVPTYGCGELTAAAKHYVQALNDNQVYRQVWEPLLTLPRSTMPTLWLTWTEDTHFPLNCVRDCAAAASGPQMFSLVPRMRHSHPAGWTPPDSYAFAQSVVTSGHPWSQQTSASATAGKARAEFTSDKPFDSASLRYTSDTGFTGERSWRTAPAMLEQRGGHWIATAALPAGTTAWFMDLTSGDLHVASTYEETAPRAENQ